MLKLCLFNAGLLVLLWLSTDASGKSSTTKSKNQYYSTPFNMHRHPGTYIDRYFNSPPRKRIDFEYLSPFQYIENLSRSLVFIWGPNFYDLWSYDNTIRDWRKVKSCVLLIIHVSLTYVSLKFMCHWHMSSHTKS